MQHANSEPFLVGEMDDTPTQAADRHRWELQKPDRRRGRLGQLGLDRLPGSTVTAAGKAGLYRIVASSTGCKAYPVAS